MSELPHGIPRAEPAPPRESALGVVVRRREDGRWEALLARRSRQSRFLGGHLAFPGGKLDPEDGAEHESAMRRCASRELGEEVGLRIAPEAWLDAGERTTPALFPVRFRTRFFVAEAPARSSLPDEPPQPEEIDALRYGEAGDIVRAWERGDLLVPPPVLAVLRAMETADPATPADLAELLRGVNASEREAPRIEFVPGIWMLPVRTATLPPATHTNVWMPGGRSFVVIDPGSDEPEEIARLVRVAERRRREGATLAAVVLSHHHIDHVAGWRAVAGELGAPLRAHREVVSRLDLASSGIEVRPIEDDEVIDLGGLTLRALLTPGHAPGHLAFHVPERDVLIASDLVSGLSTILIDPGHGDMGLYVDSLRRVQALRPKRVLPSHGPPLPGKVLEKTLAHRQMREDRILAALVGGPRTAGDIARETYEDMPEAPLPLAEQQTVANLRYLASRGLVVTRGPLFHRT